MDHNAKARFILALHKHSLQAFDAGGMTTAGGGATTIANNTGNAWQGIGGPAAPYNPAGYAVNALGAPLQNSENEIGGIAGGLASALTTQNQYQAQAPNISYELGNYGNATAGQNALAGTLANESAGQGLNPAQLQLLQNQQGISQQQAVQNAQNRAINPGLAARTSAQNAAATGSSAVGQAGVQSAQQALTAQQQLGQLYNNQVTGAAQVGNTINTGQLGAEGINAQVAQNNANAVNQTESGVLEGAGTALNSLLSKGGMVKKMASGGDVNSSNSTPFTQTPQTNMSDAAPQVTGEVQLVAKGGSVGKLPEHLSKMAQIYHAHKYATGGPIGGSINTPYAPSFSNAQELSASNGSNSSSGGSSGSSSSGIIKGIGSLAALLSKGGEADKNRKMASSSLMTKGGPVKTSIPSQKATIKDDSLKNDKVPALLSQGEIVIPRHITQHPEAAAKAAAFVQAVLNKRRMGKSA